MRKGLEVEQAGVAPNDGILFLTGKALLDGGEAPVVDPAPQ